MSVGASVREVPATLAQRMLWMLDHHRARSGCLNYPLLLGLTGELDRAALARAVNVLVARHEALRTTFVRRRGRLCQVIHPARPVEPADRGTVPAYLMDRVIGEEAQLPVDPREESVRATLWSTGPAEHVLCLNVHHLNIDAWSCRVLVQELARLLAGDTALPPVTWQFRHAAEWRRRQVRADAEAREYWTARLAGAEPVPLNGRPGGDGRTAALAVTMEPPEVAAMTRLAHREQTTLFAVLAAAMASALSGASGRTDVCFAAPFANRLRPESLGTVGMLANLAILRVRVPRRAGPAALVPQAARAVDEARPHQHFPYLTLPHLPAAGRLDDVFLQLLPALPDEFDCGRVRMRVLPPRLASRFPLEMALVANDGALTGTLQYQTGAVDEDMVHRVAEGFAEAVLVHAHRQG